MQTKNGTKVTNLQFIKDSNIYVGIVNGKPMAWDKDGRRTKHNRSKYDLQITPPVTTLYVNVLRYGNKICLSAKRYPTASDAAKDKGKFYVKTVAIEI